MRAIRLPNGNLVVPRRADGENGEVGDGHQEIGPDHPDFERWLPHSRDARPDEVEERAERMSGPLEP